jgi:hypothetical protein
MKTFNASRSQKSESFNHTLNHNFIQHRKKHHSMMIICKSSNNNELEDMNENLHFKANEDNHDYYTKKNSRKENACNIKEIKLV